MQEQLLKVPDIASALNISASQVRKFARNGTIRAIKIGSDWRFKPEVVNEYIEGQEYYGHQARKERLAS